MTGLWVFDSLQPEGSQNSSPAWKSTCNIGNTELKDNGCSVVVFHYAWTYRGMLGLGWSEAGDHKGRLGHHVPSVEHPQQLLWCGTLWGNECSMTLETSRGQNIFKRCVCVALTSQCNQQGLQKVVLKVKQSSSYLCTFANSGFKKQLGRKATSVVFHFIVLKGKCFLSRHKENSSTNVKIKKGSPGMIITTK